MMYVLGILTGVVMMGFTFLALLALRTPLQRTLNQLQSKLQAKGSIIEPDSAELSSWMDSLKSE